MKLTEWDEKLLEPIDFSEDEISLIESLKEKLEILELKKNCKISTKSWIGIVKLNNYRIEIHPKFDPNFRNLPLMIDFTNGHYNLFKTTSSVDFHSSNLLEMLARVLLLKVYELLRFGLLKGYKELNESSFIYRGRLNFKRQIQKNFMLKIPLHCYFDDFNYNTWENQIILSALDIVTHWSLNNQLKSEVTILRDFFQQLCPDFSFKPGKWKRFYFHYNRLNNYYQEIHDFCMIIIAGYGLEDIYRLNQPEIFCFLIDMNQLFEKFVERLIKVYYNHNYVIKSQQKITNSIIINESTYKSIKPDILIYNSQNELIEIIDVKYKPYGAMIEKIPSSDIYQLSFYAYSLTTNGSKSIPHAKLVFYRSQEDQKIIRININPGGSFPCLITAIGLNIQEILKYILEDSRVKLSNILERIIQP